MPQKKKTTRKTTSKAKKTTSSRAKRVSSKVKKPKRSNWYYITSSIAILVLLLISKHLYELSPQSISQFQANLFADVLTSLEDLQQDDSDTPVSPEDMTPGAALLISKSAEDANSLKLYDVFSSIFPDLEIQVYQYESQTAQDFMEKNNLYEVPTIAYRREVFDSQPVAPVIKDLFIPTDGYYTLRVDLVNPSGQIRLDPPPSSEGAVVIGSEEAPLKVYVYSDPTCLRCRAHEQNSMGKFFELADQGEVQLVLIDLPQNQASTYHTSALSCVHQRQPVNYQRLRQTLFGRPQLTKPFTKKELDLLIIDPEEHCDQEAHKRWAEAAELAAENYGISGIPAVVIQSPVRPETLRITGAQDLSVYEAAFELMKKDPSAPESEESSETTE